MKAIRLQTKIMIAILSVILFLGTCMSIFGFILVEKYVYRSAQERVNKDLGVVRDFYEEQFKEMNLAFNVIDQASDTGLLRKYLKLDYLYWVPASKSSEDVGSVVKRAFDSQQDIGGTRIIKKEQIEKILGHIENIPIKDTPKAKPSDKKILEDVMSVEYAKPFADANGNVEKVLVGGKILNRNFGFIDNMLNTVYENKLYRGKPVGTITIFQDDVRIATNVLNNQGKRAIGTRVSEVVYDRVIKEGERWDARAFVVTDWYFTAYEPIKNINNEVVGILYVGLLEEPFTEIKNKFYLTLLLMILAASIIAVFFSLFISGSIARSITKILKTTNSIAEGALDTKITTQTDIIELNELITALNNMSSTLSSREETLDITNRKLGILNKSYLDLIGFVSHELKGILSSIVLNTYLLRKGILGPLTEKQEKTLSSMSRNLDYLTVTVKNFLNLSRIEKHELQMDKSKISLKEHIFDVTLESFEQAIKDKGIVLKNDLPENLVVNADPSLLQIVSNNLISNAIKYGVDGGIISITGTDKDDVVEVEIYNDGQPIQETDVDKLFKKFSRVVYRGMEKIKGSGIGLYITKEILKMHGGIIKVVPREKGNSFIIQIGKD
ncbi:MAG: cache domain-containing protein [Candidatus Omnitrophica bacterium]|nr:cache domain-containing protein [Candidatus Omnitrophota bacterium]